MLIYNNQYTYPIQFHCNLSGGKQIRKHFLEPTISFLVLRAFFGVLRREN